MNFSQTKKDPTSRWTYPDWWYTQSWLDGRVELVMIDTSVLKGKEQWNDPAFHTTGLEQALNDPTEEKRAKHYEWIEQTLRDSTAEILIVSGHYPVFSAGDHGSTKRVL